VIGGLLQKLQELKLTDSTMIVFMGDNGFTIGEQGMFGKDTTFELASRVPTSYYVPWLSNRNGGRRIQRTSEYYSTLDLLPTVTSLMNVPIDPNFPYHGLSHGASIALLASDQVTVARNRGAVRRMAFTQVYRCPAMQCTFTPIHGMNIVGYSVRNDDWRYTAYLKVSNGVVHWDRGIVSEELYDHTNDPKTIFNYNDGANFAVETINVAAANPSICQQMFGYLRSRFNVTYELNQTLFA
jgi:iduronate 2-sulfatase